MLSNFYFKPVYQLQETQATRALDQLDLRLKVSYEAQETSKKIKIYFFRAPTGNRTLAAGKCVDHLTNMLQ